MSVKPDFGEFVAARGVSLLRLAGVLLGNRHDAEDLAQETLYKAYKNWEKVRRAERPEAYVNRMMINIFTSGRRHQHNDLSLDARPDVSARASPIADVQADSDWLLRGLSELSPRERTALVLKYYLDHDTAEIADLMGIAESSVRSNLSRGIASLKAHLKVTPT